MRFFRLETPWWQKKKIEVAIKKDHLRQDGSAFQSLRYWRLYLLGYNREDVTALRFVGTVGGECSSRRTRRMEMVMTNNAVSYW